MIMGQTETSTSFDRLARSRPAMMEFRRNITDKLGKHVRVDITFKAAETETLVAGWQVPHSTAARRQGLPMRPAKVEF